MFVVVCREVSNWKKKNRQVFGNFLVSNGIIGKVYI